MGLMITKQIVPSVFFELPGFKSSDFDCFSVVIPVLARDKDYSGTTLYFVDNVNLTVFFKAVAFFVFLRLHLVCLRLVDRNDPLEMGASK